MLPSKPLKVKAIGSYRQARYPSHLDPDPIQNPTSVPYPFQMKTLACAVALASCLPADAKSPRNEKAVEESPEPFTASRFTPRHREYFYRPEAFMVGGFGVMHADIASPIDMAMARQAIFNAFKKERIRLSPAMTFEREDIRFTADGYDPKKHMGFVMIEGKEARLDWGIRPVRDKVETLSYLANEHLHLLLQSLAARVGYVGQIPLWYEGDVPEGLSTEAARRGEVTKSHPIETEASVFIVTNFPFSLANYDSLRNEFLSRFGDSLAAEWNQTLLTTYKKLIQELATESGPPESMLPDALRAKVDGALLSDDLKEVDAILEECRAYRMDWNSRETLSPDELSALDKMVADKKEYIAVISQNDIPFKWPIDYSEAAVEKSINSALREFEDKVRNYIRWARQQGLQ